MVKVTYFAHTTVTTCGLGDMLPRSNLERVVVIIIFIFGIAVFSYTMATFLELLQRVQDPEQKELGE